MKKKSLNINFINKLKNIFFPFYRSNEIKRLFKILEKDKTKNKEVAMFVGGCVRKHLSKEIIDDIDIASIFTPIEIKEKFRETEFKVIDTGIEHGSVTVIGKENKFELTTLRKDVKTDGRHAEVLFTEDWQQDSQRRDFTINSIYLSKNGKVYDPQLGVPDLKQGKIKFIGKPINRIEEDYLRIIRFMRFSIHYNYLKPDFETLKALKLNLNKIQSISKERIFSELNKILKLKNVNNLQTNEEIKNLFLLVFPELKFLQRLKKLDELSNHYKVGINMILAALLIDEKDNHEYFCHKYRTSNRLKIYLDLIFKNYIKFKSDKNYLTKHFNSNIYFLGKDNFKEVLTFLFLANSKFSISEYLKKIDQIKQSSSPKFPYNGKFVMDRGVPNGKKIGESLKLLENAWVKNDFKLADKDISNIINKFQ